MTAQEIEQEKRKKELAFQKQQVPQNYNDNPSDAQQTSVAQMAPVNNEAQKPTEVVAAPQVQNVGQVNIPQQKVVAPSEQKVGTFSESQGGVNAGGAVENSDSRVLDEPKVEPRLAQPVAEAPSNDTTQMQELFPNAQQVEQGNAPSAVEQQNFTNTDPLQGNEVGTPTVNGAGNTVQGPAFMNDPAQKTAFENEVKSWGLNGNVDHLNRPVVSGKDLRAADWDKDKDGKDLGRISDDASATLFSVRYGDEKNNIALTPIKADGTVLTPEQLDKYKNLLIEKSGGDYNKMLELDKKYGGLLIGRNLPEGIEDKIHQAHEKYYLNGGKEQGAVNTSTGQQGESGKKENNVADVKQGDATSNNGKITTNEGKEGVKEYTMKDFDDFNDQMLSSIIIKNRGKDSEAAKAALKKAAEVLESRGVALPPTEQRALDAENEKRDKETAKAVLAEKYGNSGNVKDLDKRRVVSEGKMREAGWNAVGNQSVYPQLEKIKDKDGKAHNIIFTPILPNGDVLTQEEYKEYVKTFQRLSPEEILENDTHGIIIKIDADNRDVDELDDLTKKALSGELVNEMSKGETANYDKEQDEYLQGLKKQSADIEKKIEKLRTEPIRSVLITEAEKRGKEYDDETEKIKKKQRINGIIANIGDVLQGFANLAGTWYGAKSSDLTSLSAAANAGAERELTRREKRRDEMMKNLAKIKDDLEKKRDVDINSYVKQLAELNKEARKWEGDAIKTFRDAEIKKQQEQEKTKQQNQRRAVEAANRRKEKEEDFKRRKELAKYQSDLRRGDKQTPTYAQMHPKSGSSKKKGKGGRGGGSRPASRR